MLRDAAAPDSAAVVSAPARPRALPASSAPSSLRLRRLLRFEASRAPSARRLAMLRRLAATRRRRRLPSDLAGAVRRRSLRESSTVVGAEDPADAAPDRKRRRELLTPPPPRQPGEEGEPSRTEVGLELLGDIAPAKLDWSYPLADEQWRCFAGYLPRALDEVRSRRFFELVRKGTTWLQPSGRWGPLPLRTAWMTSSPCACKYRYGGAEVPPEPFPEWMQEILAACMPLCGLPQPQQWPNSCNLNLYVDGQHSVGWHADNEGLFQGWQKDCRIISLSLGQTRTFELQCASAPLCKLSLADGDLCTMEGLTQKHYRHRVPKDFGKGVGERINLTWRWVVEHASPCSLAAAAAA